MKSSASREILEIKKIKARSPYFRKEPTYIQQNNETITETQVVNPLQTKLIAEFTETTHTQQIKKQFIVEDGIATDTETGLMWLQFAYGQQWKNGNSFGNPEKINWRIAMKTPQVFNQHGGYKNYTDWRIPSIGELTMLVDQLSFLYSKKIELLNFHNTKYWSATENVDDTEYAWFVDLKQGTLWGSKKPFSVNVTFKLDQLSVLLVRDPRKNLIIEENNKQVINKSDRQIYKMPYPSQEKINDPELSVSTTSKNDVNNSTESIAVVPLLKDEATQDFEDMF
ncbi:MAG: DUF1566 domain-containing protein [Methylococcaceae bacterium]|jgi:hypothetical protein